MQANVQVILSFERLFADVTLVLALLGVYQLMFHKSAVILHN